MTDFLFQILVAFSVLLTCTTLYYISLSCVKIGKAPRAQSHITLHADILALSCACRILAAVCIFSITKPGPVVSRGKPDLRGCLGHCSASAIPRKRSRRRVLTWSSSFAELDGAFNKTTKSISPTTFTSVKTVM